MKYIGSKIMSKLMDKFGSKIIWRSVIPTQESWMTCPGRCTIEILIHSTVYFYNMITYEIFLPRNEQKNKVYCCCLDNLNSRSKKLFNLRQFGCWRSDRLRGRTKVIILNLRRSLKRWYNFMKSTLMERYST